MDNVTRNCGIAVATAATGMIVGMSMSELITRASEWSAIDIIKSTFELLFTMPTWS